MSKEPRKKKASMLDEEDLFGDLKSMDDFIASDSFEVTSNQKSSSEKFEISGDDKKKKPGNTRQLKKDVSKLQEDELFGDFKSMDEFIDSDSFDVTTSEDSRAKPENSQRTSSGVSKLQEDDLFGDFKPLDEFIESDSYDVTVEKTIKSPIKSTQIPPTTTQSDSAPSATLPTGGPTPPPISPISNANPPIGVSFAPPSITPAGSPRSTSDSKSLTPPSINTGPTAQIPTVRDQSSPAKPEVIDKTKSKIAEIAKKRKEKKQDPSSRKGEVSGMFDDLDPLVLDDED